MVFGQVAYLSPQATVQRAKLKTGTTILVLPVEAADHGKGSSDAEKAVRSSVAATVTARAAASVTLPAAASASRIDYSKWDHFPSSSDEEEEEEEKRRKERSKVQSISAGAAASASTCLPRLFGTLWDELPLPNPHALTWEPQDQPMMDKRKGRRPERARADEYPEKLQLLCRADMVHYLDVRDAWGLAVCECCFDRSVSQRTKHALIMTNPKDFRYHLRETQPFSIPLAPNRLTRAMYEFSSKVPVPEAAARLGVPPHMHFPLKCDVAPLLCAEMMILEWMAEPRVGVLMDLGRIRSCLPEILSDIPMGPAPVNTIPVNTIPVNTNPVIAVFTYRAASILRWARTYGSDIVPASQCCKENPQGKVRPMRHPLRDLPSLLVRLGAIPKPVDQDSFAWEYEEWPQGDEVAAKLPNDPSAKFFHLGIVEEARGTAGECGAGGEKGGQGSNAAGKTGTTKGKGGDKGRGKQEGRSRGRGGEERVRGVECDLDERLLQQLLTKLRPLLQRKYPIFRCTADAEFLLEFAGHLVKPPACAQCKPCLAVYSRSIPFLTLIANYAYRPASVLFNRFVSLFPPLSPEFNRVAARMGVPPFPAAVPGFLRSALLHNRAELDPVLFLLAVAPKWAAPILGITDRKDLHRLRDGEEDDGRVWEEVQMWWLAVEFAWTGSMKLEAETLSDRCKEGKERAGRDGARGEEIMSDKWRELWKRAAMPSPATALPPLLPLPPLLLLPPLFPRPLVLPLLPLSPMLLHPPVLH
ncbi:unnamed protein product [Closterium sp. Yama58-4]|nr:unnamed protein product [Closterium sp. Yama58-4]